MAWELEVIKAAASAYLTYQSEGATQDSLNRLAGGILQISAQIQGAYESLLNTLISIRRDELKGRTQALIEDFRSFPRMSDARRDLFQRDASTLFNELHAIGTNNNDYPGRAMFDVFKLIAVLAPIHAFANRSINFPSKNIFVRVNDLSIAFVRQPIDLSGGNFWRDPEVPFRDPPRDVTAYYRAWLRRLGHPFIEALAEGHWRAEGRCFKVLDNHRCPADDFPNDGSHIMALWDRVARDERFSAVMQVRQENKKLLDAVPPSEYAQKDEVSLTNLFLQRESQPATRVAISQQPQEVIIKLSARL